MRIATATPDARRPTLVGVLAALVLGFAASVGQAQSDGLTAEQAQRYQALVNELRCLVCQNQSIADSNAPLASDLREQVRSQILAGRSDTEITDYVTARYGDFVLYRPPFKPATWLLWLGPFALLMVALTVAGVYMRRHSRRRAAAAAAPDREQLRRLLDEDSR